MKVSIALDPSIDEPEILIRAPQLTEEIATAPRVHFKAKVVGSFSLFIKIVANIFWIWKRFFF